MSKRIRFLYAYEDKKIIVLEANRTLTTTKLTENISKITLFYPKTNSFAKNQKFVLFALHFIQLNKFYAVSALWCY
jgi:hypothetical protein